MKKKKQNNQYILFTLLRIKRGISRGSSDEKEEKKEYSDNYT